MGLVCAQNAIWIMPQNVLLVWVASISAMHAVKEMTNNLLQIFLALFVYPTPADYSMGAAFWSLLLWHATMFQGAGAELKLSMQVIWRPCYKMQAISRHHLQGKHHLFHGAMASNAARAPFTSCVS